jgi:hypothetical protein
MKVNRVINTTILLSVEETREIIFNHLKGEFKELSLKDIQFPLVNDYSYGDVPELIFNGVTCKIVSDGS